MYARAAGRTDVRSLRPASLGLLRRQDSVQAQSRAPCVAHRVICGHTHRFFCRSGGNLNSRLSGPLASSVLATMHPESAAASVLASLPSRLAPPAVLYRAQCVY